MMIKLPRPATCFGTAALSLLSLLSLSGCASSPSKPKPARSKKGRPIVYPVARSLRDGFGPEGTLAPIEPGSDLYKLGRPDGGTLRHFPIDDARFLRVILGEATQNELKKRALRGKLPAVIAVLPSDGAKMQAEALARAAGLTLGDFIGSAVVRRQPTRAGKFQSGTVMPRVFSTGRADTFVLEGYGIARCMIIERSKFAGGRAPAGIRYTSNVHWYNATRDALKKRDFKRLPAELRWLAKHFPAESREGMLVAKARSALAEHAKKLRAEAARAKSAWPGLLERLAKARSAPDLSGIVRVRVLAEMEALHALAVRGGLRSATRDFERAARVMRANAKKLAATPGLPAPRRWTWMSSQIPRKPRKDFFRKLSKALDVEPNAHRRLYGYAATQRALYKHTPFGTPKEVRKEILAEIERGALRAERQHRRKGKRGAARLEAAFAANARMGKFTSSNEADKAHAELARFPSNASLDEMLAWTNARTKLFGRYDPNFRNAWRMALRESLASHKDVLEARVRELEHAGFIARPLVLRRRFQILAGLPTLVIRDVDALAKSRAYYGTSGLGLSAARAAVVLEPPYHARSSNAEHLAELYSSSRGMKRGFATHFAVAIPNAKALRDAREQLGIPQAEHVRLRTQSTKNGGSTQHQWKLERRDGTPRLVAIDLIAMQRNAESFKAFGRSKKGREIKARIDAKKKELEEKRSMVARAKRFRVERDKLLAEERALRQRIAAGKASPSLLQELLRRQDNARDRVNGMVGAHNNLVRQENGLVREFNELVREQRSEARARKYGAEAKRRAELWRVLTGWYERRIKRLETALQNAGTKRSDIDREVAVCRFLVGRDREVPPELRETEAALQLPERIARAQLRESESALNAAAAAQKLIDAWKSLRESKIHTYEKRFEIVKKHFETYRENWADTSIRRLDEYGLPKAEKPYVKKLLDLALLAIDR